jgi:PKD repeat protein
MGDGETQTTSNNRKSHTYSGPGNYTIEATSDTGYNASLDVDASYPDITIDGISVPDSVSNEQDFDASIRGNNLSQAAEIRWDMGDGTILRGRTVTHRYATSGNYEITVDAIINDESVASGSTTIQAQQFVL